jgi:hypothetical protein
MTKQQRIYGVREAKMRSFMEKEFLIGTHIIISAEGYNCRGSEL